MNVLREEITFQHFRLCCSANRAIDGKSVRERRGGDNDGGGGDIKMTTTEPRRNSTPRRRKSKYYTLSALSFIFNIF